MNFSPVKIHQSPPIYIIAKTKSTFLQNEKYIFRDFSETSLNAI